MSTKAITMTGPAAIADIQYLHISPGGAGKVNVRAQMLATGPNGEAIGGEAAVDGITVNGATTLVSIANTMIAAWNVKFGY